MTVWPQVEKGTRAAIMCATSSPSPCGCECQEQGVYLCDYHQGYNDALQECIEQAKVLYCEEHAQSLTKESAAVQKETPR